MHEPVLLQETMEQLVVRTDGFYVDATYGYGGHAAAILEQLGPQGRLWLLDQDPRACAHARNHFGDDPRVHIVEDAFMNLSEHLRHADLLGQVDGLLLDLGVSSVQLNDPKRGFSFRRDGPLDMRMSGQGMTAAEWLAEVDESELAEVLACYGEERNARHIAKHIVRTRNTRRYTRTQQLAHLLEGIMRRPSPGKHQATRTFQAIRIFINRELEQLDGVLGDVLDMLAEQARLAIISFHSLEDRRVKHFLRAHSTPPPVNRHHPAPPFTPSFETYPLIRCREAEVQRNPRSRSARLRSARRLPCAA